MADKTLDELRTDITSTVASYHCEMGSGDDSDQMAQEEVAEFEAAVRADEGERLEKSLTEVEKAKDEIVKAICIHLTGPGYSWPYNKANDMAEEMAEDLITAVRNEKP